MGAFESGQSFLAGVLAKLPAEQRAQAEAIFTADGAKEAVTLAGDGALARGDYSRNMDTLREKERELTAYYERLNGWYADNRTALDRAREAEGAASGGSSAPQPASGGLVTPVQPAAPPPGALTAADIRRIADEAVNDAGRDYIAVTAFLATQGARHAHLFGEPLDMTELVAHPKLGRPVVGQPGRVYSLQDAYLDQYGERLAAKQKEFEDKRFNEEVEKRLAARVAQQTPHPFPLRAESSPLDVLSTKDGPAAHNLDTAVAEYERLQAARGS
ncbi:MAG TPA: hypothetical protein VIX41_07615 [Acidimicrobiales bacterium]